MLGSRAPRSRLAGAVVQLLCSSAFLALLCVRVDGVLAVPFSLIFVPVYTLEGSALLQASYTLIYSTRHDDTLRYDTIPLCCKTIRYNNSTIRNDMIPL